MQPEQFLLHSVAIRPGSMLHIYDFAVDPAMVKKSFMIFEKKVRGEKWQLKEEDSRPKNGS